MSINLDWYTSVSEEELAHERRMRLAMDDAGPSSDDLALKAELDELVREVNAEVAEEIGNDEEAIRKQGAMPEAEGPIALAGPATSYNLRPSDVEFDDAPPELSVSDPARRRYPWPRGGRRAWHANEQTLDLARKTSTRTVVMTWADDSKSTPGNLTKSSLDNKNIKQPKNIKALGKNLAGLPMTVPDRTTAAVNQRGFKLPAWKNLAGAGKDSIPAEIVFGLRVASVSHDGAPIDREVWREAVFDPSISFLSLDMSGEAARRFLVGENGDAGMGLRRGLLRALERAVGGLRRLPLGSNCRATEGGSNSSLRSASAVRAVRQMRSCWTRLGATAHCSRTQTTSIGNSSWA